eukprot:2248188-Pyramimonas_sp.AAC.1
MWSQLEEDIVGKVMAQLQWERGASASFRFVCRRWRQMHDALLTELFVRVSMDDPEPAFQRFRG